MSNTQNFVKASQVMRPQSRLKWSSHDDRKVFRAKKLKAEIVVFWIQRNQWKLQIDGVEMHYTFESANAAKCYAAGGMMVSNRA